MTPKPAVIFRADGSAEIGLGHLYRSAALAQMLAAEFSCYLAYVACPVSVRERFADTFSGFIELPGELQTTEHEGEARTLVQRIFQEAVGGEIIVVLDGYQFKTEYQRTIKGHDIPLVCIDDIYAYEFLADVVINHAPIAGLAEHYRADEAVNFALGLEFALLRTPFLSTARRPAGEDQRGENTIIAFGGADPDNLTANTVDQLAQIGHAQPLDIILGPAFAHRADLERVLETYPGPVTIHVDLDDEEMIALYRHAAIALLPASTTLIEALACNVPVVAGYYVDNQTEIYSGLVEAGYVKGIGDWNNPNDLAEVMAQVQQRPPKATQPDGFSPENLRAIFRQLAHREPVLVVRTARREDVNVFFNWANDPVARQNSISQQPIPLESHLKWFDAKLADPDTLLLIFSQGKTPCAQVRYDVTGERAVVSISLDKDFRGQGLSRRILDLAGEQLRARYPQVTLTTALVRPENLASARLFRGVGYRAAGRTTEFGDELLVFTHKPASHTVQ